MCQLTFCDLGTLNKVYLTQQLILNSLSNPDGCGILSNGKTWRSEHAAYNITNLGECLNKVVTEKPTIGHVRFASDKKLISRENSHPFTGKRLILAHNGKLDPKDYKKIDKTKVDTHLFLTSFEEWWDGKLDFPTAISEFMKEWEGKFALMIYDIKDKKFYIIRGESADLHYTTVNEKLVINTAKKELEVGLDLLVQINYLFSKETLKISEIKEIDKNTIFTFDPKTSSLLKVGEIKENKSAWIYYQGSLNTEWEDIYGIPTRGITRNVPQNNLSIKTPHIILENFLGENLLFLTDLNKISMSICGTNLIELTKESWETFIEGVLNDLKIEATKEKLEIWRKILISGLEDVAYNNLEFPWMLNEIDKLKEVYNQLKMDSEAIFEG